MLLRNTDGRLSRGLRRVMGHVVHLEDDLLGRLERANARAGDSRSGKVRGNGVVPNRRDAGSPPPGRALLLSCAGPVEDELLSHRRWLRYGIELNELTIDGPGAAAENDSSERSRWLINLQPTSDPIRGQRRKLAGRSVSL